MCLAGSLGGCIVGTTFSLGGLGCERVGEWVVEAVVVVVRFCCDGPRLDGRVRKLKVWVGTCVGLDMGGLAGVVVARAYR
jgi:hypothetical protein